MGVIPAVVRASWLRTEYAGRGALRPNSAVVVRPTSVLVPVAATMAEAKSHQVVCPVEVAW